MAPDRLRGLMEAIDAELNSQDAPPLLGGLGGGFKLHQGRRPEARLPPQPRRHRRHHAVIESPREPLYADPSPRHGDVTLESVIRKRSEAQQQACVAKVADAHREEGARHHAAMFWGAVEHDPLGLLQQPHHQPPNHRHGLSSCFEEIDQVHQSIAARVQQPRGITLNLMQRIGGGGSRIDYSALRAQFSPRR